MAIQLENLKESNEFLNILFDNITSALFIIDRNVRIENINDSFSILFQKREDQIIGELCGNAIGCMFAIEEKTDCGKSSFCSKCKLRKDILHTMSQHVPSYKNKLTRDFYTNGIKQTKHFLYSTRYIQYNGESYTLIIVDDHTELENQRAQLQEKNKSLENLSEQKSKFLGIAAHDLRNPIGAIHSFSEILLDSGSEFEEQEQKEFIGLIKESSQFSLQLLNELLDLSKIELGKLELDKRRVNIEALIQEVIKINKVFARKKKISIHFNSNISNHIIEIDANKIEQVLHNLLSNAIKYSQPETTTNVYLNEQNNCLSILVKDEGVGIPENELKKLFTEFGKTSAKTTANESSTGLGLAIAKKIIEGHKGTISATSKLGEGSEFLFTLPLN